MFKAGPETVKRILDGGELTYVFAVCSVIILPIHVEYLPPFIIMWGLSWILENHSRFNIIWNSNRTYKILFFLFLSYYGWQIIGLLYSNNLNSGLVNLFRRLSLVVFPLVLLFSGSKIQKRGTKLLRIFVGSTFFYLLIRFGQALYRSLNFQNGIWTFNSHPPDYPWLSYFYGSEFTLSHHPSYVSMYFLLAAFIAFEAWFDRTLKQKIRYLWIIIGTLLLITLYFLSSRVWIFISLFLIPFYFIRKYIKLGKRKSSWIVILLIIIGFLPIVLKNQRLEYLYDGLFHKEINNEKQKDPRLKIWKSVFEIFHNKNILIGVGIGDVKEVLVDEYKRIGEVAMAKERFNAHNQYLEILLENGIIGLAIFLALLVTMIYISFSEKNILYGLFTAMMIVFFIFETVLKRFPGVSFFSLFSFLLLNLNSEKSSVTE